MVTKSAAQPAPVSFEEEVAVKLGRYLQTVEDRSVPHFAKWLLSAAAESTE